MNAQDWEKVQKNYDEILDVDSSIIICHLLQNNVITTVDKKRIEETKVNQDRMETVLELIRKKPETCEAFKHFMKALKSDPVNESLHDKILKTEVKSQISLKSRTDPHLLDKEVRKVLQENYANAQGETCIDEIREVLKSEGAFTAQNEWNNDRLAKFITKVFTDIRVKKTKKSTGKNSAHVTYLENVVKIKKCNQKTKSLQSKVSVTHETKAVPKMSAAELKLFLTKKFQEESQPTEDLDILEEQKISGKIFVTMSEEDFVKVLPKAPFGIHRFLHMLVEEITMPSPDMYTAFLRKFDTDVTHTVKYSKGHLANVFVNSRGKKTHTVKNFYLVEDTDIDKALEFISSEVIPFISSCINDRRNGTIYFGINPVGSAAYKQGEIVGVYLTEERVQRVQSQIRDAIHSSFTAVQKDAINATVRDAKFVPVIGAEKTFVIEVDVEPTTEVLRNDIVRTKESYLPDRFLKYHKGKDVLVFRFSDEGFPKIVSSDELILYEKVQPSIVEQRKQEESQVSTDEGPNLRLKLLNLLAGGLECIQDTIFPFLLTSPLDDHMTQDYLTDKVVFIKYLHPQVVFDFDDKGASEGLLKNIEEKQQESPRILTTDDFDENRTCKESFTELESSLDSEVRTAWMFCNGYREMNLPAMEPVDWNIKTCCSFQRALKCFMDIFAKERIIVIICLFSTNYTTMIEACDEILRKLPENWILLAETEDIAKLWQDQILNRNRANRSAINDRSVIGLPWEQVNKIICNATNNKLIHECEIPSSNGSFVSVREKKLKDWCDIEILPSNNFDFSNSKEEKDNVRKQVEEQFYRGDQVDWLNFSFKDQVLRRDIHANLLHYVRFTLEHPGREEEERVRVISVLHQPGAGGTTSSKQVLWDLRNEFRCCVVLRVSNQTCDQLDEFRQYGGERPPKPILILVDNEENFQQLKYTLDEKARERWRYGDESCHSYCTIIVCTRRATLPLQLKCGQFALRQQLCPNELEWFTNKHKMLKKRFHTNKAQNVDPEFLIAFNILRQNFNKEYVSNVVKAFTEAIDSNREIKLLKFVALLNNFDPNFKSIPVSCFDKILSPCQGSYASYHQGTRSLNWEATLSQGIKVLLNLSSNQKFSSKGSQHLKVFSKVIAQEILTRLKERTRQNVSEIMYELLKFNVFQYITADYKALQAIINNVFKRRELGRNGINRRKFSEFILHIEQNESAEAVADIVDFLYSQNSDPFTAQLLARYYIKIKIWSKAETFARRAVDKLPDNSFLWDTLGQVYKSQLFEKITPDRNIHEAKRFKANDIIEFVHLTQQCIMAFRKGQNVCELEPTTNDENNLAAYFGELRAIVLLLTALDNTLLFKNKETLHIYLVDHRSYPPELQFLKNEDQEFLKSLENFYKDAMRRLDDEFLQMKGKIINNAEQQENDRKTLISLKASLDDFFGESNNHIPRYFDERDSCDYRLRRARQLGASSLSSLLELRKEGKKDVLLEIFHLLYQNMSSSSEKNFDDLRGMLDIVTVFLINKTVIPEITYGQILIWCKEMYSLGKQKQSNRSHLEMFLYYVLYNFPTQERSRFKLSMEVDLLAATEEWIKAFRKNYPKSEWYRSRRETTLFFLGNGPPLYDVVFFDRSEVIKMYSIPEQLRRPQFRKSVRILSGILAEGGHEVILQLKSEGQSSLNISVPTAYAVKRNEMFKRKVHFYIGFSFSGPKAFGMCLDSPESYDSPSHVASVQMPQSPKENPETLSHMMGLLKNVLTELDNQQLSECHKAKLENERDLLSRKIKKLIGE